MAVGLFAVLAVSSCGGGSETTSTNPLPQNRAPTISGSPPASVVQDFSYSFTPSASDPDGDVLSFSASGLPNWADFDDTNGTVSGMPGVSDLGVHANIAISVSDGQASASLSPFTIDVVASSASNLPIAWTPPTQNADGSNLQDLAGYRIRWGTQSGVYSNMVDVNDPTVSSYLIENLVPGTYFVVVSAFDTTDNESEFSNEAMGSTQ